MRELIESLGRLPEREAVDFVLGLTVAEQQVVARELYDWNRYWARDAQRWPEGQWSTWVINAGRGFGKTRTGAEAVNAVAKRGGHRIALVARTGGDVRDVVVEGESGLLVITPPWARPHYEPSKRRLTWPRPAVEHVSPGTQIGVGAEASVGTTFTADEPDMLRGPQFHFAWCDEVAAWRFLKDSWDNLQFGLRLGDDPRCIVTTTPKPLRFLRDLFADPSTVVTGGSTYENRANLARHFLEKVRRDYEGTALGRQELYAELLDEAEGALWKRSWIEAGKIGLDELPTLLRIVVAIDPAVSSNEQSDETGIVIAGMMEVETDDFGVVQHFYVIDDLSGQYTPAQWGRKAIDGYDQWEGDRIIGEANNGGDMVESTVRVVRDTVPFRKVHASKGKDARAEPVAALTEQGRVHFVRGLEELEDQLCNWVPRSNQRSPDRLDAMVWAITELMTNSGGDRVTSIAAAVETDRVSPWSAL